MNEYIAYSDKLSRIWFVFNMTERKYICKPYWIAWERFVSPIEDIETSFDRHHLLMKFYE